MHIKVKSSDFKALKFGIEVLAAFLLPKLLKVSSITTPEMGNDVGKDAF